MLETVLRSMDADRLNSLKRRSAHFKPSSHGVEADAKASCALMRIEAERDMLSQHLQERMMQQYLWYRSLWSLVQSDKRDLPPVAHFIFDFVKQVLEYGEIFRAEMYWAMLDKIEAFEYTPVISSLIVNMVREIDGVTVEALVEWFGAVLGCVPLNVSKVLEELSDLGDATGAPLTTGVRKQTGGSDMSRGTTFVTEMG